MRRAAAGLRRHLGHRGAALLFFGLLDLIFCTSLLFPPKREDWSDSLVWLAGVLPLWVWGAAWGVVGLLCLWYAPRRRDQVGFTAAMGIKVAWGLVSLGGWLVGGIERGWLSVLVWLGFAYLVAVISSWPEPPHGWKERGWTPLSR